MSVLPALVRLSNTISRTSRHSNSSSYLTCNIEILHVSAYLAVFLFVIRLSLHKWIDLTETLLKARLYTGQVKRLFQSSIEHSKINRGGGGKVVGRRSDAKSKHGIGNKQYLHL